MRRDKDLHVIVMTAPPDTQKKEPNRTGITYKQSIQTLLVCGAKFTLFVCGDANINMNH
jgi:hypothetical protein